jgi:hypothetical protein
MQLVSDTAGSLASLKVAAAGQKVVAGSPSCILHPALAAWRMAIPGAREAAGDGGGSNVGISGGYGDNSGVSTLTVSNNSVSDPNQWYNQNPTFNIWHDLQPLIDDQIYYKALLADYPYTDRKGNPQQGGENYLITQKVAPAIYELDFCEPGPNPIWYSLAEKRTQEFVNGIPQSAQAVAGWVKTVYSFDQSGVVGMVIGAFAGSDAEKLGHIIRQGIETFYNIKAEEDSAVQQPSTIASIAKSIGTVQNRNR